MPQFEVFRPPYRSRQDQPIITIYSTGTFGLNEAAYMALGQPAYITFVIATDDQLIGLQSAPADSNNAYQVRKPKTGRSYQVSGHAFARFARIDLSVTHRYPARMVEDVLVIDRPTASPDRSRSSRR